jgi:predicted HicB family RNase H-like nuclease
MSIEEVSMNIFRYKGFIGSIEASAEDKVLYGKLLYITHLVTYEAGSIIELETEFKNAVNDYLLTCKQLKREPMKPFKGSLNVRIGSELHKEAALHAAMQGVSVNEFIKIAVQSQIQQENGRIY